MEGKTVYFVRHAQSDASWVDERTRPLTAQGQLDAQNLVTLFWTIPIDRVYSSPYARALETAGLVAVEKHLPVEVREDFRERNVGRWFETLGEFRAFSRRQWSDFSYREGGESLAEVQERNIRQVRTVLTEPGVQTVLIGTHGTALTTILNFYDVHYGLDFFEAIAEVMPLVVRVTFQGNTAQEITIVYPRSTTDSSR